MLLGFLGGFLVMVALLAQFYAPGQLMRTPLDVDSTTHLSGDATVGSEPRGPVLATSVTRADSAKSDGDVVVFVNSACLVKDVGSPPNCVSADDPQKRLLSASVDNFATDRKTGQAVNDPKYLPPDATPHRGLVNKWPFDAQKQTYPYWDGTANAAGNAVYDGETTLQGLKVYKYRAQVPQTPIDVAAGVKGTYTTDTEIYVEPRTGAIVNTVQHQERLADDGSNVLNLDLAFTSSQEKSSVKDAISNKDKLDLVTKTVPLIGFVVGIPLLIAGIALTLLANRRESTPRHR